VKPANLLVSGNHQSLSNAVIKLADFNLAETRTSLSQTPDVCGTPFFLSPEQLISQPCSFTADVWSLGVTIYYMACF
jgi:serine/threonine protein kinase